MKILPALADERVAQELLGGMVGVIPTDTVYGLAAVAANPAAVARLYALKSRERKPGTVIAASIRQLANIGIDLANVAAVDKLWPGPVSVVLPANAALDYAHQGLDTLAVRIPKDENLLKLLRQTGPLVTSSANHPGKTPAHTMQAAQDYFGATVDFYVDGGDLSHRLPSTIVRLDPSGSLTLLRPGAVKLIQEDNEHDI